MDLRGLQITWLGHGTFRIQPAAGPTFLLDAWVDTNPKCPEAARDLGKIDALLITHGHGDHISDVVPLVNRTTPRLIVGAFELCDWLESKGIAENLAPMNKGGSTVFDGCRISMVHADHSCGIEDGGKVIYGGEAVGYIIDIPDTPAIYASGDTAVFGDMRLIAEIYQPDIAIFPIGDYFTMGPLEAAYATRLSGVKAVVPGHYATFPQLTGTVAAFTEELKKLGLGGVEVLTGKPGEVVK